MLTVVSMFWRDETRAGRGYSFEPEHVRIHKRMFERNLTVPHRYICVTDEKIDGVDTIPVDWSKHVPGTVFVRLMLHRADIAQFLSVDQTIQGWRILLTDIDVVVTGNCDHLLRRQEDFVIWRNPNFPKPQRSIFQSSIRLFTAGARPELYDDFDPSTTPNWVTWRFGGREQAWIAERLPWDEAVFTDDDGIYGAGRLKGEGIYGTLPGNACIVSFPGSRAPWQPEVQERYPWIKEHWR